jgi:metal-responsive CopG/Arc/MetJ family transcriptional regulator
MENAELITCKLIIAVEPTLLRRLDSQREYGESRALLVRRMLRAQLEQREASAA